MTQFSFTEDYDEYGQPRNRPDRLPPGLAQSQKTLQANLTWPRARDASTPGRVDVEGYIMDRVARTTTYEIKNDGTQRVSAPQGAHRRLRLRGCHRPDPEFLRRRRVPGPAVRPDRQLWRPGAHGEPGPHRGDPARGLQECGDRCRVLRRAALPGPDGSPAWTAEYPQEFRNRLPRWPGTRTTPAERSTVRASS